MRLTFICNDFACLHEKIDYYYNLFLLSIFRAV